MRKPGWCVYILSCRDGSLYTGITHHLEERLEEHRRGTAAKYTASRRPVRLVYPRHVGGLGRTLRREAEIKSWPRHRKLRLIRQASR